MCTTTPKSAVLGLPQTVGTFVWGELLFWARPAKVPKQTSSTAQAGDRMTRPPRPCGLDKFQVWLNLTDTTAIGWHPRRVLGLSGSQKGPGILARTCQGFLSLDLHHTRCSQSIWLLSAWMWPVLLRNCILHFISLYFQLNLKAEAVENNSLLLVGLPFTLTVEKLAFELRCAV